MIDGVDITNVGLQTLRRALGVIPQAPLLMAGTIRYNLGAFLPPALFLGTSPH
jgi:ABC-type multidrug transport system fused ATPase/permease subunit